MPADEQFGVAAARHLSDGEYLHEDGRLPNADHHYGFAAECAVKYLMAKFTDVVFELTVDGIPQKPKTAVIDPRTRRPLNLGHVQQLLDALPLLANGRSGLALLSRLDMLAVFRTWSEHERYADGSAVAEIIVTERRVAAQKVIALYSYVSTTGDLPT